MNTYRRVAAGLATLATATLMTGCSSFADKSAEEIQEAAVEDMQDVTSLTIEATIEQADGDLELKMASDDEGDCKATMKQQGGAADILVVEGKEAFIKADGAFVQMLGTQGGDPAVQERLANNWIEYDISEATETCDLQDLLEEVDTADDVEKGEETEVDGEDAIELISKKDGETTTVSVATGGDHYMLKVVTEGGDEPGTMLLTDHDEDVQTERPDNVIEQPES